MRLFCRFDTVVKVFADGGYTGTLIDWAKAMFGYDVEVVKRNRCTPSRYCPNVGLWKGTSLGWDGPEGCAKTMNSAQPRRKL
jgi:hypothetical protein